MFFMCKMLMLYFMFKLKKSLNTLSSFPFITYRRVVYFCISLGTENHVTSLSIYTAADDTHFTR